MAAARGPKRPDVARASSASGGASGSGTSAGSGGAGSTPRVAGRPASPRASQRGARAAGSGTTHGLARRGSVANSADLFAARARARRRRPWRRIAIALAVAAVVGGLVWLVWFSPHLVVRQVEVEGVSGAEVAAITEVARVPMGLPLARVDTAAISERVRSRISIAEARTSRSWPSTVTVTVRPRTPALVLKNPQGQLEVVDATGVAFGTIPEVPVGVPLVEAASESGQSKEALKAALSLIRTLPDDLAGQVSAINVSSANLVTFTLGEVKVTWGGADQPQRKVQVLRALLKTGPTEIDVSTPDTPTTR